MFEGLHEIDWSSMNHSYGTAEEVPELLLAMRSPDADTRDSALSRYYSAVLHQGTVMPSTTASLPFLYELAADAATPDRAAIVDLLVSIGTSAIENGDENYAGEVDFAGARTVMRARAKAFVDLVSDDDERVRRAALPGLALFADNFEPLRDRFTAAAPGPEQLVAVEAMGEQALRVPGLAEQTAAWLAALAVNLDVAAEVRLAAVVQRVRCAPDRIDKDLVPTTIQLMAEMTPSWVPSEPEPPVAPVDGVPPFVPAAFADMQRSNVVHAWTTGPLQALHEALDGRVSERAALLTAQLRSPDLGTRLDGIPLCAKMMTALRGDHSALIALLGEQLGVGAEELAAGAATALQQCYSIAEPAREALAAYVAQHGPQGWAAPRADLRRACQEAARTLAGLGDVRALPSLLLALDDGVDDWRAVGVAGRLTAAADQLVPRLIHQLAGIDLTAQHLHWGASGIMRALAELGDPTAVPALVDTLRSASEQDDSSSMSSALVALARFGPAARSGLDLVRTLAGGDQARADAIATLWAIGRDVDEVVPLLYSLLHDDHHTSKLTTAADVFAEIGPAAVAAVPRLRALLAHDYDWVRIHAASALWAITRDQTVLDTLLQAWSQNPSTGNFVVACLDRMGPAATPALPDLLTQLALPQRGRYRHIDSDEELQRVGRAVVSRLA
ncbi:HEAT repeat domain-containing protein [Kutzneria chonburiensis]|uniref:HEAT repeat domain-containing protein n=1 Tax=Kutzneria chonburiensis TaxID=1483604 RepID=A0ABV6MJS1_9PSEU|nr:hypothetical protein [Kutzneria chonburiensis]